MGKKLNKQAIQLAATLHLEWNLVPVSLRALTWI